MRFDGKLKLLKDLQLKSPSKVKKNKEPFINREYTIRQKAFAKCIFTGDFTDIQFAHCTFNECTFENVYAFFFILKKCKFANCTFKNSRFTHLEFAWDGVEFYDCHFRLTHFDEGGFYNVFFVHSNFYGFSLLGFYPFANVWFEKCHLENSQFQSLVYYEDKEKIDVEFQDLVIKDSTIEFSYFNSIDLRNSTIINTPMYKAAFVDCKLGENTIIETDDSDFPNYASIDFQSILKSETIDSRILAKYFNVTEPDLKNLVKKMTTAINFKTVFISYSFKDKEFANLLNEELKQRGVKTFIWEKDAPSGRRLDDIMTGNIQAHEKVLFIASKNSLRSVACQFELSEGRKKQEETWENIFFPIHIDGYLFEVKKNQIRPINKAEEYWENIQEIKRVNSMDFSAFGTAMRDPEKFQSQVNKIVVELKKGG